VLRLCYLSFYAKICFMSIESKPGSNSERASQLWAKVDTLLLDGYTEEDRKGWVNVDGYSGNVYPSDYPRLRGGVLGNIVSKALGTPAESYKLAYRSASIGEMPKLPDGYPADYTPPKLGIYDYVYTPINPVDGNTNTTRSTQVLFRRHAGLDSEYNRWEDGIKFRFVETAEAGKALHIGSHEVHPYYGAPILGPLNEYLDAHGFPAIYSGDMRGREAELLDFVIAEAQKLEN
jgi:hypothetical protein